MRDKKTIRIFRNMRVNAAPRVTVLGNRRKGAVFRPVRRGWAHRSARPAGGVQNRLTWASVALTLPVAARATVVEWASAREPSIWNRRREDPKGPAAFSLSFNSGGRPRHGGGASLRRRSSKKE